MTIGALLHLDDPATRADRSVLESAGGYVWWYVDLLDEEGSGLVLIWSWGLPFLPGYAGAARRGEPQIPASRPSLNLVTYDRGRPSFYLLQEPEPHEASWDGDDFRFGASRLRSRIEGGERKVEAQLDCGLPGTTDRLQGTVRLTGPALRALGPAGGVHRWTPLAGPARGSASLRVGELPLLEFSGTGYHDRNASSEPLQAQGLRRWCWGRVVSEECLHLHYVLWPQDPSLPPQVLGVTVDDHGEASVHPDLHFESGARRRSRYGPVWSPSYTVTRAGEPWLAVEQQAPLEQGPFYLRHQQQVSVAGEGTWLGWGESCQPAGIDRPWQRPLVRMRVHRPGRPNSLWGPLFTGTLSDRGWRQVRSFLPGVRSP